MAQQGIQQSIESAVLQISNQLREPQTERRGPQESRLEPIASGSGTAAGGNTEVRQHLTSTPRVHQWPDPSFRRRGRNSVSTGKAKGRGTSKDVFCLPYEENLVLSIPRGRHRERLAYAGLTGKIFLTRELSPKDVVDEISSIFRDTFEVREGDPLEFTFLSALPGSSKKLQRPKVSSHFKWGGAEVLSACGQGCLYIMCDKQYNTDTIFEKESADQCNSKRLRRLEQSDSSDDDLPEVIISTPQSSSTQRSSNDTSTLTSDSSNSTGIPLATAVGTPATSVTRSSSVSDSVVGPPTVSRSYQDQGVIADSLLAWRQRFSNENQHRIRIRRRHIKEDIIRAFTNSKPDHTPNVTFIGECGVDTGGLTRELFTVGIPVLRDGFFHGENGLMLPVKSACYAADGTFEAIGKILAAAVIHGGQDLNFLNPVIADLLISKDNRELSVAWIPNDLKRECVQKVYDGNDISDEPIFQEVADEIGWQKKLTQLNKFAFVSAACNQYVIYDQQAAINSLVKGMEYYGMREYAISYPGCIRSIIGSPVLAPLNADIIFDLFTITYSDDGTNKREKEEATTMFFLGFLEKCNVNGAEVDGLTLEDFLEFFTGSKRLLLGGYHTKPSITFADQMLPTASTCAFSIVLPRLHATTHDFMSMMAYGIRNSVGFGVV